MGGMGRKGKLFKVNNGGESAERTAWANNHFGKKEAFYRGPRKLAVATYCTRSIRRIHAGVSGLAGYSTVYLAETPVWALATRVSG